MKGQDDGGYEIHEFNENAKKKAGSIIRKQVTKLKLFLFLGLDSLNNRYKKDNDQMILTCDMYMDPEQNEAKLQEMTKELYLEAKRAP